MRRLPLLLFVIPLLVSARENPFLPASQTETTATQTISKPKIHPQRPQENPVEAAADPVQEDDNASLPTIGPEEIGTVEAVPEVQPQRKSYNKEIINYSKARFVLRENSAYIETRDKVMRHFAMKNPPSIVIDFKASADFSSKRKELKTKPFVKLEVGAHHDYYRVVFRLDKKHRYKLETKRYGQVVTILD